MREIKINEIEGILKKENSNILIINTLPESSFKKEHIPGSINIPFENSNFVENVKEKAVDENTPIIVYCSSSECTVSSDAAKRLEEEGFTNVMHFKGGMEEWQKAKKKVKSGAA